MDGIADQPLPEADQAAAEDPNAPPNINDRKWLDIEYFRDLISKN